MTENKPTYKAKKLERCATAWTLYYKIRNGETPQEVLLFVDHIKTCQECKPWYDSVDHKLFDDAEKLARSLLTIQSVGESEDEC